LIPIISIDSLLSSCGFKIGADVSYEQLLMTISVAACEPECQAGQQVHMVLLGVWIPTAARGSKDSNHWSLDTGWREVSRQAVNASPWLPGLPLLDRERGKSQNKVSEKKRKYKLKCVWQKVTGTNMVETIYIYILAREGKEGGVSKSIVFRTTYSLWFSTRLIKK
jgi:hypothetical protein